MRLVTFDVTGTLLKFRTSPGQQYASIAQIYGIKCDENHLNETLKINYAQMEKKHPNFGLNSGIGWQKWWQTVVYQTFRDANCTVCDETLIKVAKELISVFKTSACWEHANGCFDLLNTLKERNIRVGVISNFDTRLPSLLENMKLSDYFHFVLYSYDIGVEKPNSKIFEKALELSDLPGMKAHEALHIGNSIETDYRGACNAGWNAALIASKDSKKYPDIPAENIFTSLYDINQNLIHRNKFYSGQNLLKKHNI